MDHGSLKVSPITLTPVQRRLYDYWRSLPRKHHPLVPDRSSLKPAAITDLTPFLGMAEYMGGRHLKVRFMAPQMDESLKASVTGRNAFDFYDEQDYAFYEALWTYTTSRPCGFICHAVLHNPQNRYLEFNDMHFPLCDTHGRPRLIVSTFELSDSKLAPQNTGTLYAPNSVRRLGLMDIGAGLLDVPEPLAQVWEPVST